MKILLIISSIISLNLIASTIEPGEYEIVAKNKVEGLPGSTPSFILKKLTDPANIKICIKDNTTKAFLQTINSKSNCELISFDEKVNVVTWKGKCTGAVTATIDGLTTFSKNSYTGTNTTIAKMPGGIEMKTISEYKGNKIGDCK